MKKKRHRSKMGRGASRRQFARGALKSNSRNRRSGPVRGGYRI